MKKIIYGIIGIIIIIIVALASLYFYYDIKYKNEINKIKKEKMDAIIEYGKDIEYGSKWNINDFNSFLVVSKEDTSFNINDKKIEESYSFMETGKIKVKVEIKKEFKYKTYKEIKKIISVSKVIDINVKDSNKPSLTGIKDKTINVGDKIDLKSGIKATDVVDGELDFEIEGTVDTSKTGTYNIIVKTKDKNGNEVSDSFKVDVKKKSADDLSGITSKGYQVTKVNGIYYVDGILIANKTYSLPSTYNPGGLTSTFNTNFNKMQSSAKKEGIVLSIISGFRSYGSQSTIYNNYVNRDGKLKADTYSARPGYSEHQTGLAADINSLSQSFINTKEGKWLNDNCYKYGFIIRYPKGKDNITGYMYEPWHIRYVGTELATKLYNNGSWITMEEYFGIDSKYK